MDEHLKEARVSNFLKWVDSDGFISIGSDVVVILFNIISVILYANSIGDAVALFCAEMFFEVGAIPAGVSILSKWYKPQENRKSYAKRIIIWVITVLLIIVFTLLKVKELKLPHFFAYIALFVFTIIVVMWQVTLEAEH